MPEKASGLAKALERMNADKYAGRRLAFTKEQDELLVEHRNRGLSWRQLAEAFGHYEGTLRTRYLKLTRG